MEDAQSPPKKSSTTLSVDRAAFLLLRVKKAFKKKRQQRKDKQTQAANAALISQTRSGRGKIPPPLFRSRTLPAIIVPGIPVVSLNTDRQFDERCGGGLMGTKSASGTSTGGGGTHRWSLLSRQTPTTPGYINNNNNNNNMVNIKSLNLPKDDMGVYRRKSSGSTTSHTSTSTSISGTPVAGSQVADAALLMPTCEDFECHAADGSVLLRIPAPHVVAARAYRLASKKRSNTSHDNQQQQQPHSSSNMSIIAGIAGMGGSSLVETQQQPLTPEGIGSGGGSGGSGSSSTCAGGSGNSDGATCSAGNTALTRRLAKLLHQSSVSASRVPAVASPHGDGPTTSITNNLLPITIANAGSSGGGGADGKDDAPRRLSWERRKDSSALQRSASIDSFAEIVWSDTPRPSLEIPRPSVVPFSKRPSASSLYSNCSVTSQTTQLNINYGAGAGVGGVGDQCNSGSSAGNSRRESLLSPSSTRRNKLTRIINDNILPHNLTSQDSDSSNSSKIRADNSHKQEAVGREEEEEEEEFCSAGVGSSYYFIDNKTNVDNDNHSGGGFVKADADDDIVVLRRPAVLNFNKNSSANKNYNNNNNNYYYNNNNNYKNDDNTNKIATSFYNPLREQITRAQQQNANATKVLSTVSASSGEGGSSGGIKNDNDIDTTNSTFRWSEQWTPNVAVAKIRTAISCTGNDLREMEFLLPHKDREATKTSEKPTTTTTGSITQQKITTTKTNMATTMPLGTSNSNNNNNHIAQQNNNNKIAKMTTSDKQRSNAVISASSNGGLSVARQARNSITTVTVNNQTQAQAQTPKQPKKTNINESMELALRPPNLAIYRHSSHVRTKSNGSNEMGIVGGVKICTTNSYNNNNAVTPAGNCGNTPYRNKMSKKQLKLAQAQLDKLNQINLHQHALFSAVEHGHLDKARTILESTDVDVNSINTDGLSALDVAVLSNNRSMTKMLLQHGAIEGTQFSTDTIGNKLNGLLKDAESRIQDLSGTSDGGLCQPSFSSRPSISSIIIGNTGSSVTGCTGNEIEKQIGIWERRVKGLRRLLLGWDQTRPPDAPAAVTVDVTGENTIALQILEPYDGAIGTKFKVQWSTRADFSNIVGERELVDWMSFHGNMGTQCQIGGLTQGRRYFIRATCGNVKGWGPFKTSVPASVVPSSWRDYNNREDRYVGRQRVLDNLFTAVRLARPADVSELTLDVCPAQKRNPKKKTTIKQLFSVASKFQKHLRRGIYLASIIYCEDKVLVTSEDFLPVIEIDETYPSSLHSDYHWLMKVACTWDDVKSLRTDMERNLTSAVHFRTKLLSAVCQMQSTLGLNDLGQLFYKPLRDSHGTVVLTCIQSVKSQKTVSILNSRWLPLNKLQKKIVALLEDYNIHEMLISSISEQIHYHQASMQRLSSGLYLGYLKMQCSMDQIQVVVPIKTPNVLPHCKVRDNSHITADEWQILKRRNTSSGGGSRSSSPLNMALEFSTHAEETTEGQRLFLYDLTAAAQKLFAYMNIKPQDAKTHRLYDIEIIEHSKDISFLIICPAVELTCAVPGQSELLLQRDDLASLSIQSFEMIHLRTYQPGIIQKYARLSCILELDTALATHSQREAFSTSELQTAKERLAKLHELSANLNAVWKSVRWLMDVIAFARDKNTQSSEIMKEILAFGSASSNSDGTESGQDKQLLQPPTRDAKYTKNSGRGSWPGPGGTQSSSSNCLAAEHSKSEQNLGRTAITTTSCASSLHTQQSANKSQSGSDSHKTVSSASTQAHLLQVSGGLSGGYNSSDISLRKNSGDSVTSSQYTTRSYYSGAESALGSNNELGQIFAIPPSRSDDTLALGSLEVGKHTHVSSSQRKRASSNLTQHATTPTSIATSATYCSGSAPYLPTGPTGSNISLKASSSSDYDIKMSKANKQPLTEQSIDGKVKAASSANLRDSALYHKSTLATSSSDAQPTTSNAGTSSSGGSAPASLTTAKTASIKSLSRHSSEEDTASGGSSQTSEPTTNIPGSAAPTSGIIQVYTAYNTGLASGTSLKLHVTPKTTAREVINLVVKQLNMAAVLKGNNGPIYTADMLDNFCLVAVIGARERCLRDDFKPLQLQNPWRKGRLYVRQKHELLAAIEHANRKSHLI